MKTCEDCPKYNTCSVLCQEMEEFVNQDEVKMNYREATFTALGIETPENVFADEDNLYSGAIELTTRDWVAFVKKYKPTIRQKRCVYLRYWLNWSYQDIGNKYNISRQAVEQTIKRFIIRYGG